MGCGQNVEFFRTKKMFVVNDPSVIEKVKTIIAAINNICSEDTNEKTDNKKYLVSSVIELIRDVDVINYIKSCDNVLTTVNDTELQNMQTNIDDVMRSNNATYIYSYLLLCERLQFHIKNNFKNFQLIRIVQAMSSNHFMFRRIKLIDTSVAGTTNCEFRIKLIQKYLRIMTSSSCTAK